MRDRLIPEAKYVTNYSTAIASKFNDYLKAFSEDLRQRKKIDREIHIRVMMFWMLKLGVQCIDFHISFSKDANICR